MTEVRRGGRHLFHACWLADSRLQTSPFGGRVAPAGFWLPRWQPKMPGAQPPLLLAQQNLPQGVTAPRLSLRTLQPHFICPRLRPTPRAASHHRSQCRRAPSVGRSRPSCSPAIRRAPCRRVGPASCGWRAPAATWAGRRRCCSGGAAPYAADPSVRPLGQGAEDAAAAGQPPMLQRLRQTGRTRT